MPGVNGFFLIAGTVHMCVYIVHCMCALHVHYVNQECHYFFNIVLCSTSDIICASHGCDDENKVLWRDQCVELGTQQDCVVRTSIYVD